MKKNQPQRPAIPKRLTGLPATLARLARRPIPLGGAGLALLVGLGLGYGLSQALQSQTAPSGPPPMAGERKILYYRSPMNPSVTSPVPTKDQMGMDFVPVYAGMEQGPSGTVTIDAQTVQNIGVRLAPVTRSQLSRNLRLVGRVDYNEERLARLHPKTEGWVEKLYVDKTGSPVRKNTMLFSIYSPQLVSTQEEYLSAVNNLKTLEKSAIPDIRKGAVEMVETTRERLRWLDVPEHQIKELEKSGRVNKYLHIHSPFDGIVTMVGVREGQFVDPKKELYTVADLSKVWVYADLYETDIGWARQGDPAEITLKALPGKVFTGRIAYIYPFLDNATRTVKLRLAVDNPGLLLKPDMFAEVVIRSARKVEGLAIPKPAVVHTGRGERVFVQTGPGKFEPRDVTLGVATDDLVQVVRGLKAGEHVVVSAQFLIDSDSQLREAASKASLPQPPARPDKAKAAPPALKQPPKMDMDMDMEAPASPEESHSGHEGGSHD